MNCKETFERIKYAHKRLWIVRHGRSIGNEDISNYGKMPCTVLPLTDEGEQQGRDVGQFFFDAAHHFDWVEDFQPEVIASPFKRAHHTGELALETMAAQGLDQLFGGRMTILDDLHEQSMGILDGMGLVRMQKERPKAYAELLKHLEHDAFSWYTPPQGESGSLSESDMDVHRRLRPVCQHINDSEARDILSFGHGNTNRFLPRDLLGVSWEWSEHQPIGPNTGVRLLYQERPGELFKDHGYVYEPFYKRIPKGRGGANFEGYELGDESYAKRIYRLIAEKDDRHI